MDLGLKRKNVLLFGGHSNIGRAVSRAFASEGAGVTIACRDVETGKEVAAQCLDLGAPWADVVNCDATSYEQTNAAAQSALKHGNLDVVYHGIAFDIFGDFWDLDRGLWDKIYEVNFKGPMNAWHSILPIMEKQGHGCFINVASTMGRMHPKLEPVYGAMKSALIHLCQTLAVDAGPKGVRMNIIAPGPTTPTDKTAISAGSNYHAFFADSARQGEVAKELVAGNPLQKKGKPTDNAYAALFLASDVTAGHLTGQIIGTDGGAYMPK